MKRVKPNLLVFASGSKDGGGSGFQEMVEFTRTDPPVLDANIVGVVSNHEFGGVRKKADKLKVPFLCWKAGSLYGADGYQRLVDHFKIGGGELGRSGVKNETMLIDREIIKQSGKKNPKLLFIPTASGDAAGYVTSVQNHFGKKLGCKIDSLELIAKKYSKKEISDKILNSDIIYVGGGNTLKMMKIWRKFGVDKLMQKASEKGIVLSGLSAGSICWFRYGNSDSARFGKNKEASMMRVKGLNMIPALHCPHYDVEKGREESLKEMMKKNNVAIAIDNCSAIEIIGDEYRILKTKKTANAYKVYWKGGKYFKEQILARKNLQPLSELLK